MEMAKLVGKKWQNLSPGNKGSFEQEASSAKEKYNNKMAKYKRTDSYKAYSQYLVEFKAIKSRQEQLKRLNLEGHSSPASTGKESSEASQRVCLSVSATSQWRTAGAVPCPGPSSEPNLPIAPGSSTEQRTPNMASSMVLPGYHDSILSRPEQGLPWGEARHNHGANSFQRLSLTANRGDQASGPRSPPDSLDLTGLLPHPHRTRQIYPPPLQTSEPTFRSSISSISSASLAYSAPRIPIAPPLGRALPIPSIFPRKSNDSFENQLPSLKLLFLSLQPAILKSQQSPNSIHTLRKFPSSIGPLQSYPSTALQPIAQDEHSASKHRGLKASTSEDENMLDPLGVLLEAAEIMDQN